MVIKKGYGSPNFNQITSARGFEERWKLSQRGRVRTETLALTTFSLKKRRIIWIHWLNFNCNLYFVRFSVFNPGSWSNAARNS